MRLLAGMLTLHGSAGLTGRELLKTRRRDAVQLGVLPSMGDYLVRVRANKIALQTMKVRRLVLHRSERRRVRALSSAARHIGAILLEVATHQGVQALVSCGMLHETRFVAERIAAVLAHAVEVSLMLSVAAMRIPAILVEPEPVAI